MGAFKILRGRIVSASIATVSPNAGWLASGLPGSGTSSGWADGSGVPKYATRAAATSGGLTVDAMPVLQWGCPSQLRNTGPQLIFALADAFNGVQKVTFGGDIADTDVSLTYFNAPDLAGNPRLVPGYPLYIDCATAAAAKSTGVLRIYARATPNDGRLTPRTIGPLTVYPRTVQYDWDKTVKVSGGDFATPTAAMQALNAALIAGTAECGRVTNFISGTLDWGSPPSYNAAWSKGYSCFTNAPGVTATIARFQNDGVTNSFAGDRNGVSANSINDPWYIFSYVNNLEFRGAGLTIDRKNIRTIASNWAAVSAHYDATYNLNAVDGSQLNSGSFFFNGCNVTNTAGTISVAPYQLYWNDSIPPAIELGDGFGHFVVAFADGVTCSHLVGGAVFTNSGVGGGAIFGKSTDSLGVQHQAASLTFGEYSTNSPLATELYIDGKVGGVDVGNAAVTIRYVGAGGTDATLNSTYDSGTGVALFIFDVTSGGTSIAGYPVQFQPIDPTSNAANMTNSPPQPVRWADMESWLNTNRPGDWSFSYPAQTFTPFWSRTLNVDGTLQPWPQHVKSAGYTVLASAGLHDEFAMWQSAHENIIFWGVTVTASGFATSLLNCSDQGNADWSVKNITFDSGGNANSPSAGTQPAGKHFQFENITMFQNFYFDPANLDVYSSVASCLFSRMSTTSTWSGSCIPANCLGSGSLPSGTGCVDLHGSDGGGGLDYVTEWTPLFANNPAGDFTPAGSHALTAHLFTTINPRDAQVAARGATDAVGAWKIGGTAPTWPF